RGPRVRDVPAVAVVSSLPGIVLTPSLILILGAHGLHGEKTSYQRAADDYSRYGNAPEATSKSERCKALAVSPGANSSALETQRFSLGTAVSRRRPPPRRIVSVVAMPMRSSPRCRWS